MSDKQLYIYNYIITPVVHVHCSITRSLWNPVFLELRVREPVHLLFFTTCAYLASLPQQSLTYLYHLSYSTPGIVDVLYM